MIDIPLFIKWLQKKSEYHLKTGESYTNKKEFNKGFQEYAIANTYLEVGEKLIIMMEKEHQDEKKTPTGR